MYVYLYYSCLHPERDWMSTKSLCVVLGMKRMHEEAAKELRPSRMTDLSRDAAHRDTRIESRRFTTEVLQSN